MVTLGCAAIPALVAAAATALLLPFCAAAADSNWIATKSLVHGVNRNCGDDPFSNYAIETRGMILTGTPTIPGPWDRPLRVDVRTLAPDGSGRVLMTPPQTGIVVQFDFSPGAGPRNIIYGRTNLECRWLLRPK